MCACDIVHMGSLGATLGLVSLYILTWFLGIELRFLGQHSMNHHHLTGPLLNVLQLMVGLCSDIYNHVL